MGEARRDRVALRRPDPMPRVACTRRRRRAPRRHRSIRPTSFERDPDSLAPSLKPEELRLYRLIWQRAIASQMAAKELETTTVDLADGPCSRAPARREPVRRVRSRLHRGHDDETEDDADSARLPALAEGNVTSVVDVTPTQHFTEPLRATRKLTLIKALEEHGIGRPSPMRPRSRRSRTEATFASRSAGCDRSSSARS